MDNVKVHGVNVTPLVFKIAENVTINGINIEGVGIPIALGIMPMDPNDTMDSIILSRKFNVNGISMAPLGLLHEGRVNGLALTPYISFIEEVNGISIVGGESIITRCNGLMLTIYINSVYELNGIQLSAFNKAQKVKGIQFGIINKTKSLKGFQVGLWNVNSKRKLPFINWSL